MKTRGCPCGSMTSWCYIEDGRGIEECHDCGRILNEDSICGPEDLPDKHMKLTKEQRAAYRLKGGHATALQRKKRKV